MRYYNYFQKSRENFSEAKKSFPWLCLWELEDEGIEARYHLLQYLESEFWYYWKLEKSINWIPLPVWVWSNEYIYWSISHTENFIAYAISDIPIGIDIAEIRIRDTSLMDTHTLWEYSLLWWQTWENFYLLWTAKEAIIKREWIVLDDMKDMVLKKAWKEEDFLFEYWGESYTIESKAFTNLRLSVTTS